MSWYLWVPVGLGVWVSYAAFLLAVWCALIAWAERWAGPSSIVS